jgi:hypothetical protein
LSANAGAYQYTRSGKNETNPLASFTLGAEFHLSPYFSLFADGAYTYRVFAEDPLPSIGASFGIRLNLSEIMGGRARVQTEKTRQYNVFPVSWAWYENNPIAAVTITNDEPNTITNVNLSFFMGSYMGEPWVFSTIPRLESGETIEVPVTALFNEALLNLNETVTANGILQIQYRSLGARKETTAPIQMPIYRRNNLTWDDDRRAAAFVSPRDYAARLFARNTSAAVEELPQQSSIPQNVIYAAALFEALRLYGISYIIDPSSSYTALSENASALDTLNYPYETLYYRGGDCDDLSILFCSMLEALEIETAFITVPGHIYIAFNIGGSDWQHTDIIEIEENNGISRRWLPVEITVPGRGFTEAVRIGGRQWRDAQRQASATDEADIFPMHESWLIYPSVNVNTASANLPAMPEHSAILRALETELRKLR